MYSNIAEGCLTGEVSAERRDEIKRYRSAQRAGVVASTMSTQRPLRMRSPACSESACCPHRETEVQVNLLEISWTV